MTPQILENVKVKDKDIINSKNVDSVIKKTEQLIKKPGKNVNSKIWNRTKN